MPATASPHARWNHQRPIFPPRGILRGLCFGVPLGLALWAGFWWLGQIVIERMV